MKMLWSDLLFASFTRTQTFPPLHFESWVELSTLLSARVIATL